MIALLCEGKAEEAIMELLLNSNILKFDKKEIIDEKPFILRNASKFTETKLNHGINGKIDIYRILDSKVEGFKIKFPYDQKINVIYNVLTRPEIEMLFIINEGKYDNYMKKKLKPSEYVKTLPNFRGKKIKSVKFVKEYWKINGIDSLINAIKVCNKKMNLRKKIHHEKVAYEIRDITLYDMIKDIE